MTVVRRRLIIELTQTRTPPAGAGAALEGDYSPLRARFEQAQGQALTGAEEQEYLEQHPVLARVPAHHRLFIICRQSPGHTKSYNFWVQHREVMHVHMHPYTDTHTHTHTHTRTHTLLQRPNELWYYRSLHELVDVLEGRAAEDDFSSASEVDEVCACVCVCVCVRACVTLQRKHAPPHACTHMHTLVLPAQLLCAVVLLCCISFCHVL